ncbi:molybdopterin-guanine dinucleotide biosynthesis protein B [Brevibacillus sp. AY1]|uniref:molybdopterin-guanine dinucleotide biosynthesis protein B n=1 Tax=Brevibacillus sp. AY1 TaxID=2807621 RepID=UPI002455252D|nr:molybdopterin-guanine dinucleotide biosynthesis protein B [Brevibacillus sp. AY1]
MSNYNQPIVMQLVGYSNSGKTTLLTKLIPLLEQKGLRVGVIKHDGGHDFEIDQPGKDTWRYREAGASLVAITSQTKTAMIEQRPLPLAVLIERMGQAGADLVLVEGFKQEAYPKLVLIRKNEDQELVRRLTHVEGIVCWQDGRYGDFPHYSIDDASEIASFLFNKRNK